MSTKRTPITEKTAEHPLTSCQHCGERHTEAAPLVRVSVKTMYEDDYHFECKGLCKDDDR